MAQKETLKRRDVLKSATAIAASVGGLGFFRANAASSDTSQWITVTATRIMDTDDEDSVIEGARELVSEVELKEPGVIAYICNRGFDNPNELMFFEIYENEDAIAVHQQTEHLAKYREITAGKFQGDMAVAVYQRINGFHR